jgi:hypothetical protein
MSDEGDLLRPWKDQEIGTAGDGIDLVGNEVIPSRCLGPALRSGEAFKRAFTQRIEHYDRHAAMRGVVQLRHHPRTVGAGILQQAITLSNAARAIPVITNRVNSASVIPGGDWRILTLASPAGVIISKSGRIARVPGEPVQAARPPEQEPGCTCAQVRPARDVANIAILHSFDGLARPTTAISREPSLRHFVRSPRNALPYMCIGRCVLRIVGRMSRYAAARSRFFDRCA